MMNCKIGLCHCERNAMERSNLKDLASGEIASLRYRSVRNDVLCFVIGSGMQWSEAIPKDLASGEIASLR